MLHLQLFVASQKPDTDREPAPASEKQKERSRDLQLSRVIAAVCAASVEPAYNTRPGNILQNIAPN